MGRVGFLKFPGACLWPKLNPRSKEDALSLCVNILCHIDPGAHALSVSINQGIPLRARIEFCISQMSAHIWGPLQMLCLDRGLPWYGLSFCSHYVECIVKVHPCFPLSEGDNKCFINNTQYTHLIIEMWPDLQWIEIPMAMFFSGLIITKMDNRESDIFAFCSLLLGSWHIARPWFLHQGTTNCHYFDERKVFPYYAPDTIVLLRPSVLLTQTIPPGPVPSLIMTINITFMLTLFNAIKWTSLLIFLCPIFYVCNLHKHWRMECMVLWKY